MKAKRGRLYTSQLEAWRNWNNEYPTDPYPVLTNQFYPAGIPNDFDRFEGNLDYN